MGEDALGHGAAADVAVADKEHANTHVFPPKKPYFAVICRVLPLSKMYKVLLQCQATLIFRTYLGISWQYKANRYTHS